MTKAAQKRKEEKEAAKKDAPATEKKPEPKP
jgi:hypothetical protein